MIEILFVLSGLIIQLIFLFKRKLLTDRRYEKWIWVGTVILFILGFTLGRKYHSEIRTLPVLMVPLMAYIVYQILYKFYKSTFKKEPVDTFWSMDTKLMKSGIFNFLFWVVALVVPVIVAYQLVK